MSSSPICYEIDDQVRSLSDEKNKTYDTLTMVSDICDGDGIEEFSHDNILSQTEVNFCISNVDRLVC